MPSDASDRSQVFPLRGYNKIHLHGRIGLHRGGRAVRIRALFRATKRGVLASLLTVVLSGCSGEIGGSGVNGDRDGSPPVESVFGPITCEDPSIVGEAPLRRLSVQQYTNVLRDLFGSGAVDQVSSSLALVPFDGEDEKSFSQMDMRLAQRHVDAFFAVADGVSGAAVADSDQMSSMLGSCATDIDQQCFEGFVRTFGSRVYRRPLTADEVNGYLELFDAEGPAQSVQDALLVMLMAPSFLYHMETEGTVNGNRLTLEPFALASRLSFHFWQTMPDAELFQAADDGSLMTEDGYREQVDRLASDPRTQDTVRQFFSEWYRLGGFIGFVQNPQFERFVEGVEIAGLYEEMVAEAQRLVDYYTWDVDGSYQDILTSSLSFALDERLAAIYGVPVWDGVGEPPSLPSGERSGLLTRAAFLVSGDANTNPFKRGAFIRKHVLCDPLTQPTNLPPGSLAPPDADPERTTRERFSDKVADQPCLGCHAQFSDLGYVLESYDGLGRYRTEEEIFDDMGEWIATLPVDSTGMPRIDFEGDTEVSGPVEMLEEIASNEKATACFARHYFRYTYRRNERTSDGCSLASIRDAVVEGLPLRDVLTDVAMQPAFQERVLE